MKSWQIAKIFDKAGWQICSHHHGGYFYRRENGEFITGIKTMAELEPVAVCLMLSGTGFEDNEAARALVRKVCAAVA